MIEIEEMIKNNDYIKTIDLCEILKKNNRVLNVGHDDIINSIINNNIEIKSLEYQEMLYFKRAWKLPLKYMKEIIELYKRNWFFVNEVDIMKTLINIFNCTEEEIRRRFIEVHMILRYHNNKMKKLVNERKKLIKMLH